MVFERTRDAVVGVVGGPEYERCSVVTVWVAGLWEDGSSIRREFLILRIGATSCRFLTFTSNCSSVVLEEIRSLTVRVPDSLLEVPNPWLRGDHQSGILRKEMEGIGKGWKE